jgi:hypothetical protein
MMRCRVTGSLTDTVAANCMPHSIYNALHIGFSFPVHKLSCPFSLEHQPMDSFLSLRLLSRKERIHHIKAKKITAPTAAPGGTEQVR